MDEWTKGLGLMIRSGMREVVGSIPDQGNMVGEFFIMPENCYALYMYFQILSLNKISPGYSKPRKNSHFGKFIMIRVMFLVTDHYDLF